MQPAGDFEHLTSLSEAKALLQQMSQMLGTLQSTMETLQATIAEQNSQLAELRRALFGRKSERLRIPRDKGESKSKDADRRRRDGSKRRQANADAKKELPTEDVVHEVEETEQQCPVCKRQGGFVPLGEEVSYEFEHVPARIVRRRHIRHKMACPCGEHIVIADGPQRVVDGSHYGPGFYANVVVSKCADIIPLNRLATRYRREGVPMSRSTLTDLFHRSAELFRPLYLRLLELVAAQRYVNADETPISVQDANVCRRAYVWIFISGPITVYVFSASRSGETPLAVLGKSAGILQVDGYSGYNPVCIPDGRERAGCLAHCRRKFWEALAESPQEAMWAIEKIRAVYAVEYVAAERDVLGTEHHLALRQATSATLMNELHNWLKAEQPKQLPKGRLGTAIGYALNNWTELTLFLTDPKIRLDNNLAEGRLRRIALGRHNFLFVGHDVAGQNLAVLQTLVTTCEACGVNPQQYLTDVIMRIHTHPTSKIDELLPMSWKPPPTP